MICPACDAPTPRDLASIFPHITDPYLIVTLTCDAVGHALNSIPNLAEAHSWLAEVRNWHTDKKAAGAAGLAAWVRSQASRDTMRPEPTILRAIGRTAEVANLAAHETHEAFVATPTTRRASSAAVHAVTEAAMAANYKSEVAWQLEHICELACTCPVLEVSPLEPRSRRSLLAQ